MVLRQKYNHFAVCLGFHVLTLVAVLFLTSFYGFERSRDTIAVVIAIGVSLLMITVMFVEGLTATFLVGLGFAYAHAAPNIAGLLLLFTAVWLAGMSLALQHMAEHPVRGWRLWRIPITASAGLFFSCFLWSLLLGPG